jgi:hypothetical protein
METFLFWLGATNVLLGTFALGAWFVRFMDDRKRKL